MNYRLIVCTSCVLSVALKPVQKLIHGCHRHTHLHYAQSGLTPTGWSLTRQWQVGSPSAYQRQRGLPISIPRAGTAAENVWDSIHLRRTRRKP